MVKLDIGRELVCCSPILMLDAFRYAVLAAKYGIMPVWGANKKEYDSLKTNVFGREFKNPVGTCYSRYLR